MESRLTVPVHRYDHIRGPADAPVTLLEYGDLECPHCRRAHPVVLKLMEELRSDVRFVFRHFPLRTIHPHAEDAAMAAEAAGAQGRFWEMHDLLYENQHALEYPNLLRYAERLGLDADAFERDLTTRRHYPRVREDFMSGIRSGVNGTPTLFINGARHDGSFEFPELLRALQDSPRAGRASHGRERSY